MSVAGAWARKVLVGPRRRAGTPRAAAPVALLLPFLAVAACGSPEDRTPISTARDSAGIRIVENRPEASADSCALSGDPAVVIGVREGASEDQLYRVMDATRLSDGRIAVVNQGSSQIRLYGPDGRFLHAFGREGEGPGEFRDVFQIWSQPGDTLLVGDYRPWRFHRFTPAGEHLRTVRPAPPYPNPPEVMGVLDDGSYVLGRGCCRNTEPGFHEQELHLVRHAPDGGLVDTLGVYPYGRRGYLDRETNFMGSPLFEARTRVAVQGDRMVVGPGEEPEVRVLSSEGELRAILRWSGPDRTVTPEEVETYREETLAEYEDRPELLERFARPQVAEERPVNDRFPAYATVLLSRSGEIWVRKYPRPSWPEEDDMRWMVFRGDGTFACHAVTPPSIEAVWDLYEIGADYVLGKATDELGVEYVRMYPREE